MPPSRAPPPNRSPVATTGWSSSGKRCSRTSTSGRVFIQRMVDTQFSFGELGFQEFETQRYLTGILKREGFEIELGTAGMPSGWLARWGSGRPVIALGSDVDGIPKSSQTPGAAYRQPQIDGAPGHGEGHNSGQAVNIAAALAVKEIMEREQIDGTLVIWPGIAEEQLGGKAHFVRAGCSTTSTSSSTATSAAE